VNGAGGVVPRWRHYLTLDWKRGPWNVTLAEQYQRGYTDLAGNFEDPTVPGFVLRKVGPYELYHLYGAYTGLKDLKLVAGIRNLLNRDPPYTNAGGTNYFQAGYDPGYADPRGRFFYASLTYTFK
jgi:iron complex outermembrane receptor protein